MITLIFASTPTGLLGDNQKKFGLPWHIPQDLAFLGRAIQDEQIIVGHTTYKMLPLKILQRAKHVYVLTTDHNLIQSSNPAVTYIDLETLITLGDHKDRWIAIGGKSLIEEILNRTLATDIYHTNIIRFSEEADYQERLPSHCYLDPADTWDYPLENRPLSFSRYGLERIISRSQPDTPDQFLITHYIMDHPTF